jgi:two-component system, OmpR family, KDP operon response regulator KdpE
MTAPTPLVLVVEDEPAIRRMLRSMLRSNGMRYAEAASAREGVQNASTLSPDLIITDLSLPDGDGLDVIRRIRSTAATPIIVLSARSQESTKLAALHAGADDYVSKPFDAGELIARVRDALKRAAARGTSIQQSSFEVRDLYVDLLQRRVSLRDEEVHLTRVEYDLLVVLIRKAGQVVTLSELSHVLGRTRSEDQHQLRICMAQLRRKLEVDPAQPMYLIAETGIGYRLIDH